MVWSEDKKEVEISSDALKHQHIHKHIEEMPDSIAIGTPGKGGEIKIYFNAVDTSIAKIKIENAFQLRKFAQELLELQNTDNRIFNKKTGDVMLDGSM